ncbi:dihydroorotate dehydrogenase [Aliiroseovarius sp.]|uniref:dihydroorotate dehydrogenase n=1 Tax=Aliiroseovarius sp. TaxID=1872442 RepID=UPI00263623A5|nr:dihydroorotate dehydrogenase [Aliiroseovarius sp.]
MTNTDRDDDKMLESFFEAGRADAPVPSQDLMARILADAQANMPAPAPIATPARRGLLAGLLAAVGGWPSVATMATAAVAGVWLGFVQPDALNSLSGGTLLPGSTATAYEVDDLIPSYGSFDVLLTEEG